MLRRPSIFTSVALLSLYLKSSVSSDWTVTENLPSWSVVPSSFPDHAEYIFTSATGMDWISRVIPETFIDFPTGLCETFSAFFTQLFVSAAFPLPA